MNDIPRIQNESSQVDLLVAQRQLYSQAKNYFTTRTLAALTLAILGPVITVSYPHYSGYVGLLSLVYLILDMAILENIERSNKNDAAKIQELFDTRVLSIEWNEAVVGQKPRPEIISRAIANAMKTDLASLENWYSPEVKDSAVSFGRLLCQRTNLSWDTHLRRRYAILISVILGILVFGTLLIGIKFNFSLEVIFGGLILPLIPFLEMFIRHIISNFRTARETDGLIEKIESVIDRLCAGEAVNNLDSFSRTFQDEIFRHRKSCPLVFDWAYRKLRRKQEKDMQFSISAKVAEFNQTI